jgi:GTP-binding protein Era
MMSQEKFENHPMKEGLLAEAYPADHRAGFVALVGKPNTGKSTLLNALTGFKLSAVTHKASTTRHRILGLLNGEDYQITFLDTPGVILPKVGLHRAMMHNVGQAIADADVVILLASPEERFSEEELQKMLKGTRAPILLVVNKMDLSDPETIMRRIEGLRADIQPREELVISALKGVNLDSLVQMIVDYLPYSPPYFPKDQVSDQPERFFAAELVREQVFLQYQQEVPYGTEVRISQFEDRPDGIVNIVAEIHIERESQKGIIIGKQGQKLNHLSTRARQSLEELLGQQVFLRMDVKVSENWRNHQQNLHQFGYDFQEKLNEA